jgi:hypothetical protein
MCERPPSRPLPRPILLRKGIGRLFAERNPATLRERELTPGPVAGPLLSEAPLWRATDMVRISELSLKERHDLSLAAIMACIERLEKLVRWADPRDEALQGLLGALVDNAELRIRELELAQPLFTSNGPLRLRHGDVDRLVHAYFPSLSRPLGEGYLDRERGIYLAECLEEEAAYFFRMMATLAPDEGSKNFFLHSERCEESFLEHVRHVLLRSGRRTEARSRPAEPRSAAPAQLRGD